MIHKLILGKFVEFGRIKAGDVLRMKNFISLFEDYPGLVMEDFCGSIDLLDADGVIVNKSYAVFTLTYAGEQLLQNC